jgi:DNA-directed RNA polymerase subunit RPC12/RpoP
VKSMFIKCPECSRMKMYLFAEGGHTQVFVCLKCDTEITRFSKKEIPCSHDYEDGTCTLCEKSQDMNRFT